MRSAEHRRRGIAALGCLALFALAATPAGAVTIVIQNVDRPGEGLNDNTPATPIGGNTGTTRGQQRLIVLNQAAQQWGQRLGGSGTITVEASFDPLSCTADGGTLGAAGPINVHRDFGGASRNDVWYPAALANTLAGRDLNPLEPEIVATFNVRLDDDPANCLGGGWYYGIDPAAPTPPGQTALLPVAFHELAHGLGFSSLVDETTGERFPQGVPAQQKIDIFSSFILDRGSGQTWEQMGANDALRAASARNDPNVVWNGSNVTQWQGQFLRPPALLIATAPGSIAGRYLAQLAAYGPAPPLSGLSGRVVDALDAADGAGPSTNDACTPITNPIEVAGRIALVTRGGCNFTVKSKNAQLAGAIGVIIANNQPGLPPLGGVDNSVMIPTYGISSADAATLRVGFAAPGGTQLTLGFDTAQPLAGTSGGFVRLFAPNPVRPGSSISHFSVDASPNLLMEPALNGNLFNQVDLTLPLFADIGWPVNLAPPPNQPPVISAPASIAALEDVATALTGIGLADPDAGMSPVRLTLSVPAGTIAVAAGTGLTVGGNGTALLTLDGPIGAINAALANGAVSYTSAANASGNVTLSLQANDNGNTGSGGAQSASATSTIAIAPVNDAPTLAGPASYAGTEDVMRAIDGIVLDDVDAGGGALTLALTVAQGSLSATSGGGVIVAGAPGASITLTGTLAQLNGFLGTGGGAVRYAPPANLAGSVALTLTANDNGNSGSGGNQAGTRTVTIELAAVNDAPTINAPALLAAPRSGRLDLAAVALADVDAGTGAVRLTLALDQGRLDAVSGAGVTITGSPGATLVLTGSLAALDAFLDNQIGFEAATAAQSTAALTLTLSDEGLTGSGGSLSASRVVTLDVALFGNGFE